MKWSVRIARVADIDVKIHFTFVIFLAWIAFAYYFHGGTSAALTGTLFVGLIFLCVVLHELGHALTARKFGIRTPDITLLPIGGVARLERIPENPRQELLIAIAGPLVNVVIALGLLIFLNAQGAIWDFEDLTNSQVSMLSKLALINVALVIFNLIPAFPMDGGRILRALLAMKMNRARATQIAASLGQGLAVVFGLVGLFYNPLLIFIALFVYLGATQESALERIKEASAGVPVSEAMMTSVTTLPENATVEQAAEVALRTSEPAFVVVADEPRDVVGIFSRDDLLNALRKQKNTSHVSEFMHRDLPAVRPVDPLDEAFVKMQQSGCPALPVVDDAGRLSGLITPQNIGEMLMIKSLRLRERRLDRRPAHA